MRRGGFERYAGVSGVSVAVMGSRGPVRKPALKSIKGGRDARHEPEFTPEDRAPYMPPEPDWHALFGSRGGRQAEDAHAEWELTVTELFRIGELTRTDASTAADYCLCHARVMDCERRLSNKYTIRGANGTVKNPVAQLLGTWRGQLQKHRDSLGLSPMARKRMGREEPEVPDDDSDLDQEPEV